LAALALLLSLHALPALAQPRAFDVPAQNVGPAVASFARQANVQILAPSSLARNHRTVALHGDYEIAEGLAIMLKGTGLEARKVADSVYALAPVPPPPKPPSPAPVNDPPPISEVVVTGTRLLGRNATSASPIASVSRDELDFQGVLNLEETINQMPQVRADSGQFQNSSDAQGRAKINLRNLGWQRTLVLLDGQRLLPVQAIDLNIIPSALVKRVDILTGGASSTYGSDAIAGVVNFILDKRFEGVQLNASYGVYQHDNDDSTVRAALAQYPNIKVPPKTVFDGGRTDVNLAGGRTFANGRGNISAFADYRQQDPVLWSDRDYSACRINVTSAGYSCAVNTLYSEYGSFVVATGSGTTTYHLAKDGSRTFVAGDAAYAFNTREKFAFMRSDERFTGGVFANYRHGDAIELYATYLYMKDVTESQFYPALVTETVNLKCNNAFLSASQGAALCGNAAGTSAAVPLTLYYQLNGDGSRPLTNRAINADYRLSGGIRGIIPGGWHYDLNILTSEVYTSLSDNNEVDAASFVAAIDATVVNGKVVCAGGGSCIPADIFGHHAVDPAFYAWAYRDYKWHSVTSQQDVTANITGDLTQYGVKSPWADTGVAIALGAEYRRDALKNVIDPVTQAYEGDWLSAIGGHYTAVETYGETKLPLMSGRPFVDSLVFGAGYRMSKYSNIVKGLPTSKYELLYRPVADLLLRASVNKAARAPNISELYGTRYFSANGSLTDSCAGASPAAPLAQCVNTGVTASQYGHIVDCRTQCQTFAGGGNPDLKPEDAQTLTYGAVYTPHATPSLILSVDYYDILIRNFVGYLDAVDTFNKCLALGTSFYCQYVHRDVMTGMLSGQGYVEGGTLNTYRLRNRGIDIQAGYIFNLGRWGKLDTHIMATALSITASQGAPDLPSLNCAGFFGAPNCFAPEPKWRHNLRATWKAPWKGTALSLNWRHFGGTHFSGNSADPAVSGGGCCVSAVLTKIPDYDYIDLAGTMRMSQGLSLRVSLNNLFDRTPPVVRSQDVDGTTNNPNTFTGTYDALGRTLLLGFSYKM
jgi:iron complex outermembrane recepter protein